MAHIDAAVPHEILRMVRDAVLGAIAG